MFDKDRSGHINVEEFDKLYTYVNQWLAVFKTYDLDQSGQIDESELTKGKGCDTFINHACISHVNFIII